MEWQPIETAPKDGSYFLATGWDYGNEENRHFAVAYFDDDKFHEGAKLDNNESNTLLYLDFWMPLPDPPNNKGCAA